MELGTTPATQGDPTLLSERHQQTSVSVSADDRYDYHNLFEHAGVGLLEVAFDGRIRLVNPSCAQLFGYPQDILTRMNVLEITHPEDMRRTLDAMQSLVSGQTDLAVLEKRYVCSDGRLLWSRSRVALLQREHGEADSMVAVVADITELKETQQELRVMNRQLEDTLEGGLLGMGIALEARDQETSGHTQRVVALSTWLGQALGLGQAALTELRHGAYLHDLGKLTIPDAVLLKPGRFDAAERALMQRHADNGYDLASRIPALAPGALKVIRHHHERWDGSGYPGGLAGEQIPLLARIFAICDVYDALTNERPYKHAWSRAEAVKELIAQRGRHFDPLVVDTFVAQVRQEV